MGSVLRCVSSLVVLVVVSCGGDDELLRPESIAKVPETDFQSAPAGTKLQQPLTVEVLTSDLRPALRAGVVWSVVQGSGVPSDTLTLADGNGLAQVGFTLGTDVGVAKVRAGLRSKPDRFVEFTVTATDPPTVARVTPDQFSGGDSVTIEGSGLAGVTTVEFERFPAGIVSVSATSVVAEVPACLVPGPISVAVLVGVARSNSVVGTYSASNGVVDLDVAEYVSVASDEVGSCATFPAAGAGGAEYLITVQSVTGFPDLTGSYRLTGDSTAPVTAAPPVEVLPPSVAMRFHDFLRSRELEIARLPRPRLVAPVVVARPAAPDVGDRRAFRICNSVGCEDVEDFTRVTAEVKFVGDRVVIYEDVAAPASGFTAQDFTALGSQIENDLYDVATSAFGAESDVDGNGRVIFLLSPVVNGLTPESQCSESFVTGFFFAIDLDPSFADDERSNQSEVFYAITPDPVGSVTCTFSTTTVRRLVPVTFMHELQHMISYNQHVLVRGGSSEVLWLNEALSHVSEELAGFRFRQNGDTERFNDFVSPNLVNAYRFLKSPSSFFTIAASGTGSLEERGAAWLFMRWVVDTFGDNLPRELVETSRTGSGNVEAVTGEPISRLLSEWFLTNYVADLPELSVPSRLTYKTWNFRTLYEDLHRQAPAVFDRPFPIVPPVFAGGAFQFSGVVRSGTGDFLLVTQSGAAAGFTLSLANLSGQPLENTLDVMLNVFRTK